MTKTDQALMTLEPTTIEEMKDRAHMLIKSGILPKGLDSAEKVIVVCWAGRELGLTMMQSLRGLYPIEGKASMYTNLMEALVRKSGTCEYIKYEYIPNRENADKVIAEGKRKDTGQVLSESFSLTEAKRIPYYYDKTKQKMFYLIDKHNWKAYPADMLKARAISRLCRELWSDVLYGWYSPEELNPRYSQSIQGEVEVDVIPEDSDIEIPSGVFLDGKEISIQNLDVHMLEKMIVPFWHSGIELDWLGKDNLCKGKTLMECFEMPERESGQKPGMRFLHYTSQEHPIAVVRERVFEFLSTVNPSYQDGIPAPPPPDDGFDPVDPSEPKMTAAQKSQVISLCERKGVDFDGLFYGEGINPATVTKRQAERVIKKFRMAKSQGGTV